MENGVQHYAFSDACGKIIDLGNDSEFSVLSEEQIMRLRKGANDPDDLHAHHNLEKHEYEVCNELLDADVVIDMPKPKLHMKAGVTISLKNMVGVNVRKEFLPHHTEGDKSSGTGDAYCNASLIKRIRSNARDKAYIMALQKKYTRSFLLTAIRRACGFVVRNFFDDKLTEGTWYGNETISKTVVDLNKIVRYADKNGHMCSTPQRKRLIIADMIVSGELQGPVAPTAKPVGAIAIGDDPVSFDEGIATLMGARAELIPTLRNARAVVGKYPITEDDQPAIIVSNSEAWNGKTYKEIPPEDTWNFKPIDSWKAVFVSSEK
jgi:hypothetical protein